MTKIGENIEIKSVGNTLVLSCEGDFANQETINTRSVLGYYRERRQQNQPSKNPFIVYQ